MYRTTLRMATRPAVQGLGSTAVRSVAQRRFASSAPADKPRSWKGLVARLGLAGGAVYLYSTGAVTFGEEANPGFHTLQAPVAAFDDKDLPTVESVLEEKKKQIKAKPEKPAQPATSDKAPASTPAAPSETSASSPKPEAAEATAPTSAAEPGSPQALEEEAGQQGAFNPETGEINWDCPCLGGMAHGPCGEDFKAAFSCFVYSEEQPKGMDCIEKFQGMQECFRKYPEVYGGELLDDEEDNGETPPAEGQKSSTPESGETPPAEGQKSSTHDTEIKQSAPEPIKAEETASGDESTKQPPRVHSDAVPAAWEDATADNKNPDAERKLPGQMQEGEEEKTKSEEKPNVVITRDTDEVTPEVTFTKKE